VGQRPVRFVLDHNFPWQMTRLEWPPYITFTELKRVDERLIRDHEDWEVIQALAGRGDVDGYVTNDARILALPREMLALSAAPFALIVAGEFGHSPLQASGLVMVHLEQVVAHLTGKPQIFLLRAAQLATGMRDPQAVLTTIATHHNIPRSDMIQEELAIMDRRNEERRLEAEQARGLPPSRRRSRRR
jgi:hypothetical protein